MAEPVAATGTSQPRRRVRCFWYALAAFGALTFAAATYRLDHTSLHAPITFEPDPQLYNDMLLILPMVQATLEDGTHWVNHRLGFPGVQHMHDFPVIDHFHFVWLWVIGKLTGSVILAFNLYFLLGYPLAALTMMALVRHFGVSFPASVVVGILFAALPYHQYRSQSHYFLSAYYMVPVTSLLMLWICLGRLPFFPLKSRTTVFAVVVALITASAGAYYAFFACGLLAAAGLYGWLTGGGWRAPVSAGFVTGVIVAAGVINHLPTYLYHAQWGRHTFPVERNPEEAEVYGLKITQLILPIDDHKLRICSDFKSIYNSYNRPVQYYSERYTFGLVGALGFLALMIRLLLPIRRQEPLAALAALTGFAVAIGTIGGLGAIFNQTVTPAVRCYNRIAIYIAVFSLFAVALFGDRFIAFLHPRVPRRLRTAFPYLAWAGLLALALADTTPFDWATPQRARTIERLQARYFTDAAFFREIESTLNPDGTRPAPAVFQLPYVMWPESPTTFQLGPYENNRGYLHTQTLRWSFGCIKGRETDEWVRSVAVMAPSATAPMLDRIVMAGFEGLLLDKRGYTPAQANLVEAQLLKSLAGAYTIRHSDGHQVFFDLRRHRDDIRPGRDWEAESRREVNRLCILWLEGFISHREPGYEWQKRWCGPRGTALFVNPTGETRTVTCNFRLHTDLKEDSTLTIKGGDIWSESLVINQDSPDIQRTFVVPPGRHAIRFECVPPESHVPVEPRRLSFQVSGLKFE